MSCLSSGGRIEGLHTDFLFAPDSESNQANRAVRRIVYNKNYTTSLEK